MTKKTSSQKTMRDATGVDVPIKYISKYDRERDKRCRRILARFLKARAMLEAVVAESLADIEAVQRERDTPPAAKGNFQTSSFDNLIQVSIEQSYSIKLDDRVTTARDQMLAYAQRLCASAGRDAQALYEIVQEAFAANKSGGLSIGRVLSLCRRNITAPEWLEARQMLLDSIQPERGRAYLRVSTRPDVQHDWQMIRLDLADCWPEADKEAN